MTDAKHEREFVVVNSSNLSPKVVQYEQFLNDTLRGDLKYAQLLYFDHFFTNAIVLARCYCQYRSALTNGSF